MRVHDLTINETETEALQQQTPIYKNKEKTEMDPSTLKFSIQNRKRKRTPSISDFQEKIENENAPHQFQIFKKI